MQKWGIGGVVFETQKQYDHYIKVCKADPSSDGYYSGNWTKSQASDEFWTYVHFPTGVKPTPERMIECLKEEWERKTGKRPYTARLTGAGKR